MQNFKQTNLFDSVRFFINVQLLKLLKLKKENFIRIENHTEIFYLSLKVVLYAFKIKFEWNLDLGTEIKIDIGLYFSTCIPLHI